ncbi:hypothetical protein F2Q70_00038390 [Brassica cretica]|uniref:Arabidopsis retrotransposon Orf1 C-terminal domain-containing protein n=1 Tax=Brassica cretica TaxID=69181 RepID=A0A8S9KD76_BRACR|nr:hypothetical protein F2Q70_00038390 [Brassica cretica]KAF3497833.1 hypothetical protein DY000_02052592 [Brassica cretica]
MSPRKMCDCFGRLSDPTPPLECCLFQAPTSMLSLGWSVSSCHLGHYRDWAWYTSDSRPKVGIGGLITPLLQFMNVPLGKDAAGPRFIDGTYLRIATYFSGMYGNNYVYHYYLKGKPFEVVLPNKNLTSLERPGAISFNISQEGFLGEHGSLGPIATKEKECSDET